MIDIYSNDQLRLVPHCNKQIDDSGAAADVEHLQVLQPYTLKLGESWVGPFLLEGLLKALLFISKALLHFDVSLECGKELLLFKLLIEALIV